MALITDKLAAATAVAAAFSMLATPAAAADLPHRTPAGVYDADAGNVYRHRHRRWHDRNDGVDAGDILAGVLILGGIAAIASAAERDEGDERYRYPEDAGYRAPDRQPRFESRGIERAVDMCVAEVETRDERVGSVDSAARTGEGWHVAGALEGGSSYACWIGNDGRISDVEIGDGYEASGETQGGGQWSDDDYARARAAQQAGAIGG